MRVATCGITQRARVDLLPGQHIDPRAGTFGVFLLPSPSPSPSPSPGVKVEVSPQDGDVERSPAPVKGTIVGATPGPSSVYS